MKLFRRVDTLKRLFEKFLAIGLIKCEIVTIIMISTTIFQNITRKSEKIIYSVFTILELLLRPILGLLLQLYHELGLESLEKRR